MTACVYLTVLNKPCGRAAVRRVRWQEQNGFDQDTHDWPLCPFHRDLRLADLLLSCDAHSVALLTLDGELVLPQRLPPALPWAIAVPSIAELLQLVDALSGPGSEQARETA